jgi:hypothetical protein
VTHYELEDDPYLAKLRSLFAEMHGQDVDVALSSQACTP